ncbi:MAG: hypothetical protein H0T46_22790 [Deltaproteobacteria bacterium]|nr:hypothetical protein [Deltaproteobacteria bacterium]
MLRTWIALIDRALGIPHERGTALRVLAISVESKVLGHMSRLVALAAVGHSDIALVRSIIVSVRKDWLLANIEPLVVPLLDQGTGEEYRRIAELYEQIDPVLLQSHLARCAAHHDEEVREIAYDYTTSPVGSDA